MQESGLIEIIPLICILIMYGQSPILSHLESHQGSLLGTTVVASGLQHLLCTDLAGNIFHSHERIRVNQASQRSLFEAQVSTPAFISHGKKVLKEGSQARGGGRGGGQELQTLPIEYCSLTFSRILLSIFWQHKTFPYLLLDFSVGFELL